MSKTPDCSECGLPLAKGVAEGLCMHCLLRAGVSDTVTQLNTVASKSSISLLPDFGPYHTIGVLGEGGMGFVYLAEQRQPVCRRVALKVLKSAELGSTVLARFESESQALALMDHPNIARIYDAGTTTGGRPFFAMEYVPGIPITDYCDRNLLGFRERLGLFQQVCQAVHHAHQKGVIHHHIKPSKVLIMLQDGKPIPKVIDFGVAKTLNRRLAEKTPLTEIGVLIGTPEYMSPEQADLAGLDIGNTTDIYSLGVLLYELLAGALGFDSKSLRKAGYGEIQQIIRETELAGEAITWQNRAYFFAASAQTLRRILVDDARAYSAAKRGAKQIKLSLTEANGLARMPRDAEMLALDVALSRLEQLEPRAAKVVELLFFGGLKETEAAEVLGVSPETVKRDWKFARAWLMVQLTPSKKDGNAIR
jgi:RNA polymerase sigma factor (TIGR02999 family)